MVELQRTEHQATSVMLALPDELLLIIIKNVAAVDEEEDVRTGGATRGVRKALVSLSLVNKHIRALAKERLFNTVMLVRKNTCRRANIVQLESHGIIEFTINAAPEEVDLYTPVPKLAEGVRLQCSAESMIPAHIQLCVRVRHRRAMRRPSAYTRCSQSWPRWKSPFTGSGASSVG